MNKYVSEILEGNDSIHPLNPQENFLSVLESKLVENGYNPERTEPNAISLEIYKRRNKIVKLLFGREHVSRIELDESKRGAFSILGHILQPLDDEGIGDILAHVGYLAADVAITTLIAYYKFSKEFEEEFKEELPFGVVVVNLHKNHPYQY